jgi:hypothetical protein
MKIQKNTLPFCLLLFSSLLLAACANSGGIQSPATTPPASQPAQVAPATSNQPTPDNGKAMAPSSQAQADSDFAASLKDEKDFDWVIYVKDSYKYSTGPFDTTVSLDLRAVNTSGHLEGPYQGKISGTATNKMNVPGGLANEDFNLNSDTLAFNLATPLAPLEFPEKEGSLAPLPTEEADYVGHGTIPMTSKGSVNVQSFGYSGSKAAPGKTTSIPFDLYVKGPTVRLALDIPQGTIYFNGYIRGEGKK